MKQIKSIIFLLLIPIVGLCQVQDLAKLSKGELFFRSTVFDNDAALFGYFYIYKLDDIDKSSAKYEYILLDKNLNPTFNIEYIDKLHDKIGRKFIDVEFMGDRLSLSSTFIGKRGLVHSEMFNSVQIVSLKDKKIEEEFFFDGEKLLPIPTSFDEIHDSYGKLKDRQYGRIYGRSYQNFFGYFVMSGDTSVMMFNDKKELLWKHEYNDFNNKVFYNPYRRAYFSLRLLKDNFAVGVEVNGDTRKKKYYKKIKAFCLNSEDDSFEYLMQDGESEYNVLIYTINKPNQNFYVYGAYSKNNSERSTSLSSSYGFYRSIINTQGEEVDRQYFKWEDMGEDIKIDRYGRLKGGYHLDIKNLFTFADGSCAVLFEKFKVGAKIMGVGGNANTSDMVLVQFDKDFKYKKLHVIEKRKTRSYYYTSDYLFSQFLNDEKDVVFFFEDYTKNEETKKKEWILGINKIINGEYSYEEIPMSSDDFERSVMPAKEGYILIQEHNEEEKTSEIRLERLNL
ncbi:MAG: DUF6770 family protein [Bacteroidales bacterium]